MPLQAAVKYLLVTLMLLGLIGCWCAYSKLIANGDERVVGQRVGARGAADLNTTTRGKRSQQTSASGVTVRCDERLAQQGKQRPWPTRHHGLRPNLRADGWK